MATRKSSASAHTSDPNTRAGDPFLAAASPRPEHEEHRECFACIDGWVYLGFEGEDENGAHVEEIERVLCPRCNATNPTAY